MSLSCNIDHVYNKLHSGLGNVLYLIAATYGIASICNLNVKIPTLNLFFERWGEKYKKTILRNINTDIDSKKRTRTYELRKNRNIYVDTTCADNDELFGYYQSYKYFDHVRSKILDLFSMCDNTKKYIFDKYNGVLSKCTTSVHVRRSDFCTIGVDIDSSYQNTAIEYIKQTLKRKCIFLIFSDDIKWCKTQFVGEEYIFIEGEDDYIDLYIMSLCNHNIVANSTFSWWGAYLNKHDDKIVTYPKKWFCENKKYDKIKNDCIPVGWIEL